MQAMKASRHRMETSYYPSLLSCRQQCSLRGVMRPFEVDLGMSELLPIAALDMVTSPYATASAFEAWH